MTEIILNSVFTQLALRKCAFFGSSTLGNDIYYLKEFIDLMINIVGEERVIELLKNDKSSNSKVLNRIAKEWHEKKGMKRKLSKFDKLIEKTKLAFDKLEDKNFKKTDDPSYKTLTEKSKKITALKPEIYALFVFLVNNSTLSRMTIPPDYFKILEQRFSRPIGEFDKRRVGDTPRPMGDMLGGIK